jgi:surfeit locus 1 family protein
VDESELPRQQNSNKEQYRHANAQCQGSCHAARFVGATAAPAQHEKQGYGQADENGEKYKAYEVGHNPDYLLNFNRKLFLITLAAALFSGLGIYLGFWQLSRAAQKQALEAAMVSQTRQAPLDATAVAQLSSVSSALYRPVKVTGTWEAAHTVYLDNRQMDGKVGFFVLTPLRLQPSGLVVMVQRGWVARNFESRAAVPAVQTPSGLVSVEGHIAPPPSKLYEPGTPAVGLIRQNLDLAQFRQQSGLALADFSIRQTGPASEGLRRDWPAMALGVEKHYGYAFQWFALSALVLGLYLWFQFFRPTKARSKESLTHVPPPSIR